MRKKDLYEIVLKCIGAVLLLTLFAVAPLIIVMIYEKNYHELIYTVPLHGAQFIVVWFLIFKTNNLIKFFRLDDGEDKEIELNLANPDKSKILEIGLVLFALFIMIRNVLSLILNLYFIFKVSINPNRHVSNNISNNLFDILEHEYLDLTNQVFFIVCAFLLITFNQKIVAWVLKISGDTNKEKNEKQYSQD